MQIDFSEIEVALFPGAWFHGSADFEWDSDSECWFAETITLHDGRANSRRRQLERSDKDPALATLYAQLENEIEKSHQDELEELTPLIANEHRLLKHQLV